MLMHIPKLTKYWWWLVVTERISASREISALQVLTTARDRNVASLGIGVEVDNGGDTDIQNSSETWKDNRMQNNHNVPFDL